MRWEKNGGHSIVIRRDSPLLSCKRDFTEIGAGYFTFLNKSKTQFQVFGGAALGNSKHVMMIFLPMILQKNITLVK